MPETPRIEAIDRALDLLVALAERGPAGASLAELAEATGINKSTAYRALSTLRLRGFATQDDAGTYVLGPAARGLAGRFDSPANLVRQVHPAMTELSRAVDELVHLGVLDGDCVVYLDKVEPTGRAIRVWSSVGQRVPAATTALGRALLAARGASDEALDAYTRHLPAGRHVTPEHLGEQVRLARRRGFSSEFEENEPGVACVGLALLREGEPVAALSITSLAARMTPGHQVELIAAARTALARSLPEGLTVAAPSS